MSPPILSEEAFVVVITPVEKTSLIVTVPPFAKACPIRPPIWAAGDEVGELILLLEYDFEILIMAVPTASIKPNQPPH